MVASDRITQLLESAAAGSAEAAADLTPAVYDELRALARARLARVPPGQTLQPTALVHEAYAKIAGRDVEYANRAHFFFAAARAMRDILVDQARRKGAVKRGGDRRRVADDDLAIAIEAPAEDMVALDEALAALEARYPRKHRIVMLRFFAGLTEKDMADLLEIDERTVRRDWRFARAWLRDRLSESDDA